jgi:hypothetical protein
MALYPPLHKQNPADQGRQRQYNQKRRRAKPLIIQLIEVAVHKMLEHIHLGGRIFHVQHIRIPE